MGLIMMNLVGNSIKVHTETRRLDGARRRLEQVEQDSPETLQSLLKTRQRLFGVRRRLVGQVGNLSGSRERRHDGGRSRSPCQAHAFQLILENRIYGRQV